MLQDQFTPNEILFSFSLTNMLGDVGKYELCTDLKNNHFDLLFQGFWMCFC